ncbi:ATP-binding protein, partial [Candidatus Woesearchaeota archaeon]|nr:ATP-binding protein [Candidatus Woesearchaeota archaeon]
MINVEIIKEKIQENESPILEFKKEWYWNNNTSRTEMGNRWGEFIKDIISLSNGYSGFVGQDRYLIIGYCERESKIFNINKNEINNLQDLRKFHKKLVQKLELYTSPTLLNLEINFVEIENSSLLIFKIPSPIHLTELRSELKTKTRLLDRGAVLVRKGQRTDEVRLATLTEIEELKSQFSSFSKEAFKNISSNKKENIKDRSIENTIQSYINKNSSYSLEVGYPIIKKDWSENIIFELFKISEPLGGVKEFLYLHENASQGKTLGYLKQNKLISNFESLIILTEKPKIKDIEKRKTNISSTFGTNHVFFIDEFGYEFLYKECLFDYIKYDLPIYVDSLIDDSEEKNKSAFNKLKEWYSCDANPLLVIKGYGGIGKTTLVKQFLDHIYDSQDKTGILFIDSNEIIDDLASQEKINDVYDFYQAQAKNDDNYNKFSKELLKLSVDNGSLIIVLDGIDEVIAKLGSKFDINSFLESISNNYSNVLEKAKIIITCRDYFWDSLKKNIKISEITLKPFSKNLAVEFFSQAFKQDRIKIDKAMDMAEKFAIERSMETKGIYIPYILDMLVYLIRQKSEMLCDELSNRNLSNSNLLLSNKIQNDFLIESVCEREIVKLDTLNLDAQIKFFIKMSVDKEGRLSLYDAKSVLKEVTEASIDDLVIEKLKGHPLLSCCGNNLIFRYDFFNVYFKIIYVASYFSGKNINKLNSRVEEIIASYIRYDNSFIESLCERIIYDDELVLFCMETIEELKHKIDLSKNENASEIIYRMQCAISSVFIFLICALQTSNTYQFNIESRTELMDKIF